MLYRMTKWAIVIIMLSCICGTLSADNISLESASIVARAKLLRLSKFCDFSVESVRVLRDDSAKVLAYIFKLDPVGYIVVAGNSDIPPVLAYSFTGDPWRDNDGVDVLAEILRTDITSRIANLKRIPAKMIEERNASWAELLEGTATEPTDSLIQWPPEGTTSTEGWIENTWEQGAPFNSLCPMDPVTHARSYAGCPAVAMAMIFDYHGTANGTNFSDSDDYHHNYAGRDYWIDDDYLANDFPSFSMLNEFLDTLEAHYEDSVALTNTDKAALVFGCGVAATHVYTSEGSGTFGVAQACTGYLRFGCEDVELLFDTDTSLHSRLSQNMRDALPAHLAVVSPAWDSGHNVAVDGYNTDGYYHINFGWGGTYDGWYLIPDEIPYGLTIIEGVIVDIMSDHTGVCEMTRPNAFSIEAYPNPFNGNCRLQIDDCGLGINAIEIFDINGRNIAKLGGGDQIWKPEATVGSGVYLVRAKIGEESFSKRIVYLR